MSSSGASGHTKDKILFRNYVSTPDSEELVPLVAPPQYLLERFLETKSGERLFPLAVGNPESPVLLVDCYLNLGCQIAGTKLNFLQACDFVGFLQIFLCPKMFLKKRPVLCTNL